MIQYITTLSKYFITVIIALYTLECFLVFTHKTERARRATYTRQTILIIAMHFFCFLSLCLKSGNTDYLIFYGILQVLLLVFIEAIPVLYKRINRLLINNACMLISIGLVILVRIDYMEAYKQLIIMFVSIVLGCIIPHVMKKLNGIPNKPYWYGSIGAALLLLVYILGSVTNGSKLSVKIFGISFQASEFVKILFVLCIAGIIYKSTCIKNLIIATAFAAAHVCILALSRDLGAALIMFVVYVLMIFIASQNWLYLLLGTGAGTCAAIFAYNMFRHIQVRVSAFLDPFSVIENEGYQITQSLFAISSGSWFGLGLFEGTPETIPYVETDFIFTAITQEFGMIFAVCLCLICLSCFIMFINISLRLTDNFYRLTAIGLGIVYIFQIFLTVGGGVKFIPITGVTLPLVSYGGSSIMATIFTFFLIEGMYEIRKPANEMTDEERFNEKLLSREVKYSFGVMYFFIALFMSLLIYMCTFALKYEKDLFNNEYNPRQAVLQNENVRGTIYSRDYDILAQTIDKGKNEYRFYPFYNIFSHVIGYNTNGKMGVEAQANYYLINSNESLSDKVEDEILGDRHMADSVVTSLDVGLQKVAYTAIGTYSGAVVVSNPKTGEIYALVSKPDFNPNEIQEIWDTLVEDKTSSVLLNRATQGLYPPGSTFKIYTLLEYIRENPDTYNDYLFNCNGELMVEGGKIICANHASHGNESLKRSFAQSCNSSFGNIGLMLDRVKFQETLDGLMFNDKLPLAMNYSQSVAQISEDYDELTMVRTAFGQGDTLMTPMHINMLTSAIANDGVLMKPYIVTKVINQSFATVEEFSAEESKTLMTKEEAEILTEMMSAVIESGTGKRLKGTSYTVAGKTGSAEFSDYTTSTHSWFTGFAPIDDPEICVTIILENAGTSGTHAVPMAKKIFDEYFRRYDNGDYIPEE